MEMAKKFFCEGRVVEHTLYDQEVVSLNPIGPERWAVFFILIVQISIKSAGGLNATWKMVNLTPNLVNAIIRVFFIWFVSGLFWLNWLTGYILVFVTKTGDLATNFKRSAGSGPYSIGV